MVVGYCPTYTLFYLQTLYTDISFTDSLTRFNLDWVLLIEKVALLDDTLVS